MKIEDRERLKMEIMNSDIKLTEYGSMSDKFLSAKLSDLCIEKIGVQTGPFGSQLHKEDYVKIGTPIITVEHLGSNWISHQGTPYVSDKDKERLSKYHLQEGDIVFSRVGSVDRRALVRKEENGWLFSGRCLRVRVNKLKLDPIYLSYFFGLKSFKNYIRSIAVGATMPSINTKILSDVPIYYPKKLEEQRKISDIFYKIDKKIALNTQTNETLEKLAQALFKSWFVDFDPVKAKEKLKKEGGNLDSIAKELGMSKEILALFPDEFEESELGLVPKGWEVHKAEDLSEKIAMGPFGSNIKVSTFVDSGVPVISGQHLKEVLLTSGGHNYLTEEHANKLKNSTVYSGDIIFTHAGNIGQVSLIPKKTKFDRYVISQRQFYLRPKKELCFSTYLIYFFRSPKGQHLLLSNASQVGVPSIARPSSHLKSIEVILPKFILIKKFDEICCNFFDKVISNKEENQILITLRDTLLPKLLSGEITINDPKNNK